jgi:hypothetical protein
MEREAREAFPALHKGFLNTSTPHPLSYSSQPPKCLPCLPRIPKALILFAFVRYLPPILPPIVGSMGGKGSFYWGVKGVRGIENPDLAPRLAAPVAPIFAH